MKGIRLAILVLLSLSCLGTGFVAYNLILTPNSSPPTPLLFSNQLNFAITRVKNSFVISFFPRSSAMKIERVENEDGSVVEVHSIPGAETQITTYPDGHRVTYC